MRCNRRSPPDFTCSIASRDLLLRGLDDRTIAVTTGLDSLAVDAWGTRSREAALPCLLSPVVVDILEVEGVEMSRNEAGRRRASS